MKNPTKVGFFTAQEDSKPGSVLGNHLSMLQLRAPDQCGQIDVTHL